MATKQEEIRLKKAISMLKAFEKALQENIEFLDEIGRQICMCINQDRQEK